MRTTGTSSRQLTRLSAMIEGPPDTMLRVHRIVDAEAEARIGAGRYERSPERVTQRNGTRDKTVSTTAGDVTVAIPKLRGGLVHAVAAGAAPADRQGLARGGVRGVRARGVDPQGRRPGRGDGGGGPAIGKSGGVTHLRPG